MAHQCALRFALRDVMRFEDILYVLKMGLVLGFEPLSTSIVRLVIHSIKKAGISLCSNTQVQQCAQKDYQCNGRYIFSFHCFSRQFLSDKTNAINKKHNCHSSLLTSELSGVSLLLSFFLDNSRIPIIQRYLTILGSAPPLQSPKLTALGRS